MLVLTRREGESLRIGRDVRVTIVALAGGQVRIGVEAPDAVFVHREEVWQRLEESNREAARAAAALPIPAGAERAAADDRKPVEEGCGE
jgi:carbon storage regulator